MTFKPPETPEEEANNKKCRLGFRVNTCPSRDIDGWCVTRTHFKPCPHFPLSPTSSDPKQEPAHCGHEKMCKFVILIDDKPCTGANCRGRGHSEYDTRKQPAVDVLAELEMIINIYEDGDHPEITDCNTTDEWYGHGWNDCTGAFVEYLKKRRDELRQQQEMKK